MLLAELTETLSRRPADECLWDTMEALLAGEAGSPVIERLALLAATKENSPVARHLAHDHIDAFVEWLTGWLMDRLGPDVDEVARELTLRGHPVQIVGAWNGVLGHAQAIRVDPETGFYEGGADPRGDGAALGW